MTQPQSPRLEGVIRKLKGGYGFIAGYDGQDYFFHWSVVKPESPKEFRSLAIGDLVNFRPYTQNDRPRAVEVIVIS